MTAPPTALLTTKPARAGGTGPPASCGSVRREPAVPRKRCTTRSGRPALRPRRTAVAKSSRRLSRCSEGSTSWTCGQAASGRQAGAALGAAVRDDRATGTRPHPQPETVGLGAAAVVRLEGALAHSGAPGNLSLNETAWWRRPAVTVRPRVARNARVCTASSCPSEAGGSSRRQLDLVTVRAATPSGQTGVVPGARMTRPGRCTSRTQPVDNDLNARPPPDYRGRTSFPSRPSRESHIRGISSLPHSEPAQRVRERARG